MPLFLTRIERISADWRGFLFKIIRVLSAQAAQIRVQILTNFIYFKCLENCSDDLRRMLVFVDVQSQFDSIIKIFLVENAADMTFNRSQAEIE